MRGARTALALSTFCATAVSVLAGAGDARASEARTSSLSWLRMPGADACIATQALARNVEERLGRHVFVSAAEADVSVEGRIAKRPGPAGGWHAVITLRDGKGALLGTRELERAEASCTAMNDPLALVIAVMIDPEAKLSSSPQPLPAAAPTPAPTVVPVPVPVPVPDPAPSPAPPPDTAPPSPRKAPWRFQADAVATVVSGLAPSAAAGASVGGAVFLPNGIPLGFRGYASLFLPTLAEQDGARADFDLFYVGGAVCPTLRRPAITAMICVGGQLGVLRSHAETPNRAITETTSALWNGVTEARITLPIVAPVALTAGVSGILPLLRPTFGYTPLAAGAPSAELHRVSFFAVSADAGIGFFFP